MKKAIVVLGLMIVAFSFSMVTFGEDPISTYRCENIGTSTGICVLRTQGDGKYCLDPKNYQGSPVPACDCTGTIYSIEIN